MLLGGPFVQEGEEGRERNEKIKFGFGGEEQHSWLSLHHKRTGALSREKRKKAVDLIVKGKSTRLKSRIGKVRNFFWTGGERRDGVTNITKKREDLVSLSNVGGKKGRGRDH